MSLAKENDLYSLSQVSVNYIFFGFYLFFISTIHVYHVFLIEPQATFSRYFFLAHAIVQCAIETLLLVLFANAIKIFFRGTAMALYCIVVFFLMLTHIIDFPLVRFMDMSFWYALNFISAESPRNFLELLYASNVSLPVWLFSGVVGFGILLSGIYFYRLTEKWAHRRPLVIHYPMLAAMLCTLCLFLMSWDYSTHKWVGQNHYDLYQKTLPWKNTLFQRHQEFFSLAHPLKEPESQQALLDSMHTREITLEKKPDIFLFIIESLREDFVQKDQAPHLFRFKQENIHFDLALANANATQISWFSLFYSQFPFYWGKINPDQWKKGSIPLRLLKEAGYKIHCYSSARLGYYQMDEMIFGEKAHLLDEMAAFGENHSDAPYVRDRKTMDKLIQEVTSGDSGGRMFIVFLDSTHHDYSWPQDEKNENSPFTPYDQQINYFKAAVSNAGLEMVKNRYRNALHYVDSLFGSFMQTLNSCPENQEAVVIITGDHGEEFYEEGRLFHASSLSHPQTHIALYYKLGKSNPFEHKAYGPMSCHMDIFPTLFHYLTGKEVLKGVLQGQSIFNTERWPFTVMARFNASRSPCEFGIHNGKQRLIATFSDERNIFGAKGLRIISLKNDRDEIIPHDHYFLKEHFGGALDQIFAP